MDNPLIQAIIMSLLRRILGYVGIAAAVAPSLDGSIVSTGGAVAAAATAIWSLYAKVKAARDN